MKPTFTDRAGSKLSCPEDYLSKSIQLNMVPSHSILIFHSSNTSKRTIDNLFLKYKWGKSLLLKTWPTKLHWEFFFSFWPASAYYQICPFVFNLRLFLEFKYCNDYPFQLAIASTSQISGQSMNICIFGKTVCINCRNFFLNSA